MKRLASNKILGLGAKQHLKSTLFRTSQSCCVQKSRAAILAARSELRSSPHFAKGGARFVRGGIWYQYSL